MFSQILFYASFSQKNNNKINFFWTRTYEMLNEMKKKHEKRRQREQATKWKNLFERITTK